jgi:transposase-like protein
MGDIHHPHRLTDQEKIEIVNERLCGDLTDIEIAERYKISAASVGHWRKWARKFGFEVPAYNRRIPQRKPEKFREEEVFTADDAYTLSEIIEHYRAHRDDPRILTILRDMTGVKREDIKQILIDAGEYVPNPPRRRKKLTYEKFD